MRSQINPCIWCNNNAKEMADFYCKAFPHTTITEENDMVVMLDMDGQRMMLLNGGDVFEPNPSISFMALCQTEEAVNQLWSNLLPNSKILMELNTYPWSKKYGWIQDQYNVSWQIYLGDTGHALEKYVPTLMFSGDNNGKAAEAIHFYTDLFPNSEIQGIMQYDESTEDKGNVQHAQFNIDNYTLMAMDSSGEHLFNFNEGISLVKNCKDQAEIDKYWTALTADGGQESMCGWLKDKYGVSWQIVPENMTALLKKGNPQKAMEAVMKMKKINIAEIESASTL